MATPTDTALPPVPKGSKRVVFTVDEQAFADLEQVRRRLGARSLGDAIRISLALADALQRQAELGFVEVITRSPKTGLERRMRGTPLVRDGRSDG